VGDSQWESVLVVLLRCSLAQLLAVCCVREDQPVVARQASAKQCDIGHLECSGIGVVVAKETNNQPKVASLTGTKKLDKKLQI